MRIFPVDRKWGVPLDAYLEQRQISPMPVYPMHIVQLAIRSIDPDSSEIISDSTLEAILSIVHYPELLGLLVHKRFTFVWLDLLDQYLKCYSASGHL